MSKRLNTTALVAHAIDEDHGFGACEDGSAWLQHGLAEGHTARQAKRTLDIVSRWTQGEASIEVVIEARRAAAASAAAYAASARCLKQGARIVRKVIPWAMVRDALAKVQP